MQMRRLILVTMVRARQRDIERVAAIAAAHLESRGRLIVEAMAMVERNAASIAKRLPAHIDKQDLLDAGYMALVQAAGKFDEMRERGSDRLPARAGYSQGPSLAQYARQKVRGAMWELIRRRNWREMSHSELPEEQSSFTDDTWDPHALLEEKQRRETATAAMECLSDRERFVVQKYYAGDDLTSIGAQMGGLRKDSVCRIHTRALGKMREYFAMRGVKAA